MAAEVLTNHAPKSTGFWKALLAAYFSVIVFIALFNFLVNPFGIYPPKILPVITFSIYEQKVYLLSKLNPPPSSQIIGSSRVQYVDPEVVEEITGRRCFNWSLWGSRTEILYACIRMALEEFHLPIDLVIVGVEPEMFHLTSPIHSQARITDSYMKYFSNEPVIQIAYEKAGWLFSYGQTHASFLSIYQSIRGNRNFNQGDWREDGFKPFEIDVNTVSEEVIREWEQAIDKGIDFYLENYWKPDKFTDLSEERKEYFRKFLDYCVDNGIQVYVFMPPQQPEMLRRIYDSGGEPVFEETKEFVRDEVLRIGGVYRDLTDLDSFGGDVRYFRDEIHMIPQNGEIMVRELLGDFDQYASE
jgi:hypothetical protein